MQKTQNRIEVRDGALVARVLDPNKEDEMDQARAFRHRVFLEELGWSVLDSNGEDFDQYDPSFIHFGAFSESNELIGYCRIILPKSKFMIEDEFADLVAPDYRIRKDYDTAEVSRFAISKELRGTLQGLNAIALLVRSLYLWAKKNNVRYMYAVCASDHLEFLREFFSCLKPIGSPHEYQPGISSSALVLDLNDLDVEKVKEFWAEVSGKGR